MILTREMVDDYLRRMLHDFEVSVSRIYYPHVLTEET